MILAMPERSHAAIRSAAARHAYGCAQHEMNSRSCSATGARGGEGTFCRLGDRGHHVALRRRGASTSAVVGKFEGGYHGTHDLAGGKLEPRAILRSLTVEDLRRCRKARLAEGRLEGATSAFITGGLRKIPPRLPCGVIVEPVRAQRLDTATGILLELRRITREIGAFLISTK